MINKNQTQDNKQVEEKSEIVIPNIISALALYERPFEERHFLLQGLLPQGTLGMLFGTSDVGKSMLARDFALHIVLGRKSFMGRKLDAKHNRVLYVSTEDDASDWMVRLHRSIVDPSEKNRLDGLSLMFPEGKNIISNIYNFLKAHPTDLLVVDVATDFPIGNINDTDAVRRFLNQFKIMSKNTGASILILHHIAKGREGINKDNAIGSQAWTSAPRAAWMLTKDGSSFESNGRRLLTLVKGNFASDEEKNRPICLQINEQLSFDPVFSTSALEQYMQTGRKLKKSENPAIVNKVMELYNEGHTIMEITEQLRGTEFEIGKTYVSEITRENKAKNGNNTEAVAA